VLVESQNEHKHELSCTARKGRAGRGGGRSGGRASGFVNRGHNRYNHHNHYNHSNHQNNSATTLSARTHLCVLIFILCLSF